MTLRLKSAFILLWPLLLCAKSYALGEHTEPAEEARLEIDGKISNVFNKKHCGSTSPVKVILSQKTVEKTGDFSYRIREHGDQKTKPEAACGEKISEGSKDKEKFTKSNPVIEAKKFIYGNACDVPGDASSRVLCIYSESSGKLLAYAPFNFNTKMAKFNGIKNLIALNGEIKFRVDFLPGGGGPVEIQVCYAEHDISKGCPNPLVFAGDTEIVIPDLKNHTRYNLAVRLKEGENEPTQWELGDATPIPAAFPLNVYQGSGGELQFGCTQCNGSSLVLLCIPLLALLFLRRNALRRNRPKGNQVFLVLVGLLLFEPRVSHAELGQMNFGLIGSMYRPDLDSEPSSNGFYRCFFRRNRGDAEGAINPLIGAEFDWHLWDGFGSLQLGFGVGYTFKTGDAVEIGRDGKPKCDEPIENAKVALHMYQIRPQLTYVFDPFADYVPLIPYIRGAMVGHGYYFTAPGKVKDATTKPGGFRFGYLMAAGLMLRMDFLEPSAVKAAFSGGLFEHVYLKSELSYLKIDTFGRPGFQFSAKDVMGSTLPLMWTFGIVFEML